ADAPRPSAVDQRLRDRLADAAGRRRRKPWHGPAAKIEHQQDAHAFAVSARLHALRADPQHAGTSAQAIDGKIRRSSVHNRRFSNRHYGIKMRGWLRGASAEAAALMIQRADGSGRLQQARSRIYQHLIHMHCNRMTFDDNIEARALALLLRTRQALSFIS